MLTDQIDLYLLSLTSKAPRTVKWYRRRLQPLRAIEKNISSVTLSDLQAAYASLVSRSVQYLDHPSGRAPLKKPLSVSTLHGYVRAWRAFFNWLVDDGQIVASPARKLPLPRLPKNPPKAIVRSDMEKMVEAARRSSPRDYAIVCILADSACRVSGLCAITLDNLDLDQRVAVVIEKGQARFLMFTPRTVDAIGAYLAVRPASPYRALFLGERRKTPLLVSGINQLLDRLALAAGVVGRHNPHAFRHGWARAALRNGADISDVSHVLGHSSIQVTYEFYERWDLRELQDIHDRATWLTEITAVSGQIGLSPI